MFVPDREALAWAAGFFDGEGCTSSSTDHRGKKNIYTQPHISIHQAEPHGKTLLERFRRAVGGLGRITGPYCHGGKPYHEYRLYGRRQVQAVVAMLWTFLGRAKKDQMIRVFSVRSVIPKTVS